MQLKQIRHKLGLSQSELARSLPKGDSHYSTAYISQVECGTYPFTAELKRKIEDAFNIKIDGSVEPLEGD